MLIDEMHYQFKLELERVDSSDKVDIEPWEIDTYLNKAISWFLEERYGVIMNGPKKRGFETDQVRISQLSSLHVKSPHVQPAISPTEVSDGVYEVRLNSLGNNINGQYFRYLFLTEAYVKASKGKCNKYIGLTHEQTDDRRTIYTDADWTWRHVNYNFGRSTKVLPHDVVTGASQSPDTTTELLTQTNNRYNNDELSSLYLDTRNKYAEPQFNVDLVYISYIKYPNRVFKGGYDHIDGLSNSSSPQIHCDIDDMFHPQIVRKAARLAEKDIRSDYNAMLQDEIMDVNK